jgi:hypothetical protein
LIVGQFLESRHLRTGDARADTSEKIDIFTAVGKVAGCEGRASIAASFTAMAGLASLPVKSLSGSYRN